MLALRRPSEAAVRSLLDRQEGLPFSYPDVGAIARGAVPSGYVQDHHCVELGRGPEAFSAAQEAIGRWAMFRTGWTEVVPASSPIEPGRVVAIVARSFGAWTVNPARIVESIDESGPVDRFGFVYGALPDHAESGEERFSVEWRHGDDSVWYDLLGISRPGRWYSKMAGPLTRSVQKKFARDSKAAMVRFVLERLGS